MENKKLPKGWKWIEINKIGKIVTGNTPPRNDMDNYGGNIPWIKPEDLDKDIIISKSREYLSENGAKQARILPKNSVIVSCIGNIGKMAISGCDLATNQQINSIVLKEDFDAFYIFYTIKYALSILKGINQALVPILNASDFGKIKIPIPENIETQRKIALKIQEKLSEIEKIYDAALRQKDAADSLQTAILREIFKFNEGDKLPKGWKWEKIGDCISNTQSGIASGEKSRSEGIMHLRMNNISRKGNLDLTEFWRIPATEQTISKYSVKGNDILFNNTNSQELVGKTCFIENDFSEPVLFSNHITRIRTNEKLIPEFLVYWINILWENEFFYNECERWVNQAAFRVKEKLYPTLIPIPENIETQRQIALKIQAKLSEVEKIRDAAAKQLEVIKSLPSAILKEVFEF